MGTLGTLGILGTLGTLGTLLAFAVELTIVHATFRVPDHAPYTPPCSLRAREGRPPAPVG